MISEIPDAFAEDCPFVSVYGIIGHLGKGGKAALLDSPHLDISGTTTKVIATRTAFGGLRPWLICPDCGRRCGKLYAHPLGNPIACRFCLGLDYRSHRYWGMTKEETASF